MRKQNKTKYIFQVLCGAIMLCMGVGISCLNVNGLSNSKMLSVSRSTLIAGSSFFQTAWKFIKTNWLWFAVGGGALILLIIFIVCFAVAKHKKAKNKEQKYCLNKEQSENSENQDVSVQPESEHKEEQDEVTVEQVVQPEVTEPENLSSRPTYQDSTKSFSDVMDYLKMKMHMEQQNSNYSNSSSIIPQKIDVIVEKDKADDRVRQIQKEYQEELYKIDELLHEQEKAKLHEEMEQEQILIDKLQEEYEIADNLLDELYKKDTHENVEENIVKKDEPIEEKPIEEKPKVEPVIEEKIEMPEVEENVQTEVKEGASGNIVITPNKKLSLQEAYKNLSSKQKEYFRSLRDYADKKPNSRSKETKNHVVVGCGNKHYIRLSVKRGLTIASFPSENEEMMRLRLSGIVPMKAEEVQMKIVDDNSFAMAKQMIDIRVNQVAKEKQILKEIRKENRTKNKKKK